MRSLLGRTTSHRFRLSGQVLLVAAVFQFTFLAGWAPAQSYFDECSSETGNNATVVIPASADIHVDDRAIEEGDEIAVFDEEGRCAGATTWTGEHVALTVWGENKVSSDEEGLEAGEPMQFRLWSAADEQEWGDAESVTVTFSDRKPYFTTENAYAPDQIYVIESLHFEPSARASR